MSYCLNLACQSPQNPSHTDFCQSCGAKLLLKGRYRATKPIGQGGFGKTFLGVDEDKPSKPPCVIQLFLASSQGTDKIEKAIASFNQEGERLESLGKNSQIPELLAHFEQEGKLYLIQEYIAGQNLEEILKEEGVFSETRLRELLTGLLPVLQYVHQNNVIHRDIKPENIIRQTRRDKYVLVDLGAARYITGTDALKTGTIIGDPRYMADEQLQGKAVFASDLYSLGLTCLHLLTNVEPWNLYDTSEGEWVWRDYLTTPISQELGKVLDKLVQKPTKRRFQNVEEVLAALNPVEVPEPEFLEFAEDLELDKESSDDFLKLFDEYPFQPDLGQLDITLDDVKDLAKVACNQQDKPTLKKENKSVSLILDTIKGSRWRYWVSILAVGVLSTYFFPSERSKLLHVSYPVLSNPSLKPFISGDKWGYKDENGQIIIPPYFDSAQSFSGGLAMVKLNGKYGYIDSVRTVIEPQFDEASSFSEGLAKVRLNYQYGYIDQTGQIVIPPQFYEAESFSGGLAKVRLNDKYGYIDQTGQVIIPAYFDEAASFSEGLAMVKINSRYGYINQTGQIVISPDFDEAKSFSEGLAIVKLNWRYGYIDQTGKIIIPSQFDSAESFSEGLAKVRLNNKYGYIDKTGRVVSEMFDTISHFNEGLAVVKLDKKYGYIDKTGQIVIPLEFEQAQDFSDGKAKVESKEFFGLWRKRGYIDKTGTWLD